MIFQEGNYPIVPLLFIASVMEIQALLIVSLIMTRQLNLAFLLQKKTTDFYIVVLFLLMMMK